MERNAIILPEKTISSILSCSSLLTSIDSLKVPDTFFDPASPISITQNMWSSELCVTSHSQTSSMPDVGKVEEREKEWQLSIR